MLSKSLRSLARVGNAQKVSSSMINSNFLDSSDSLPSDTSLIIRVSRLRTPMRAGKYLAKKSFADVSAIFFWVRIQELTL